MYLKKSPDNKLDSTWVIGIVEQVLPSRDGKVRRVVVKYTNASGSPENDVEPQFTNRAVRQLVKIFDIDEYVLQDDMTELMKRLDADKDGEGDSDDQDPQIVGAWLQSRVQFLSSQDEDEKGEWFQEIQESLPHVGNTVTAELVNSFIMAAINVL